MSKWLDENRLAINLKKGKTEAMLIETAKRRSMIESLIMFLASSEYMLLIHTST